MPLRIGYVVAATQESNRYVHAGDDGCGLIAVCG